MIKHTFKFEPLNLLVIIWCVFFINFLLPINLNQFGISPRTIEGLAGILFMPFLHKDLIHLVSNSLPLVLLASLIRWYGKKVFWYSTLFISGFSGMTIWLLSPPGLTIGASGLVFGYWSFLITLGFSTRSFKTIGISLLVIITYGSLIFSFFRFSTNISWIAHFSGAVAGFLLAFYGNKKLINGSE